VFFAEGSGGHPANVKYTVQGGKYVLLPVMTYIWTFFEPCAERVCATRIINDNVLAGVKNANLTVDGVPVPDSRRTSYWSTTTLFHFKWTPDQLVRTDTAAYSTPCRAATG
jgi:hypothetical protein